MAFSTFRYHPPPKFPAAHDNRSANDHQPSHSDPRPSAVTIPATDDATGTYRGSAEPAKDAERGYTQDDGLSLSYAPSLSNSTKVSRPSTPPHNPRATAANSRYFSDPASSISVSSSRQLLPTLPTSINSSLSDNSERTSSSTSASCSACQKPIFGEPFQALGTVLHLNCVRCVDCNAVVTSKFFSIKRSDGKLQLLCESDYFRRPNLPKNDEPSLEVSNPPIASVSRPRSSNSRGGRTKDDGPSLSSPNPPLNSPNPPFPNASGSSPRSNNSHSNDTHPSSEYYNNITSGPLSTDKHQEPLMTGTPITATSSPRLDDYLSNGTQSIPSQGYAPRSAPPGHPSSLPSPRPSFQYHARAVTSPSVQTPDAGVRPPMTSGPSSHTDHSSSTPTASSAYNGYQQKPHSAHGRGSNNSQQPSYFGPGPSGVQIPATSGAPATFGKGGSSKGGGRLMEDDDLPLNSPNPPSANASGSRPSSPRLSSSHSDDTHPSSEYYNNITSSGPLSTDRHQEPPVTVTPITATPSLRREDYLSNDTQSILTQGYPPRSAAPGHPSPLPSPRPSFQHLTRPVTPPSVQTPNAGMRPPMISGPSSNPSHSSPTTMAASAYNGYQQKSHSEHGHGSNNSQQPSYFGPGPSGVQIPATYGAPGTFGRDGGGGRMEDDDLPLNLSNLPSTNASGSRPPSPRSNNSHSDDTHLSSPAGTSSTTVTTQAAIAPCSACQLPMSGQFVRALGTVFHLDCFRCGDCNIVVASKFFPIEGSDGKQHPLCERDYFRRLNLICATCGQALRGSHITACNKKYHVEHFTCSVCPTLFGSQDSWYEHNNDVYCHFHYSTRFAIKCVGCGCAILKQFVEINRNLKEECWHPECYMIHKFWNVKVASQPTGSLAYLDSEAYAQEEVEYNATTLKEKQWHMEALVYRIWTHLSTFEESSAACISEMLQRISNGMYLDAIRMAEKFILHVEVLFAVIDELEAGFARAGAKGMSHVREARMLCRKTVNLLDHLQGSEYSSSLSNPSPVRSQRVDVTQALLSLVTSLAHYLKILIRIALTGALKLEREHSNGDALLRFLGCVQRLGIDGADPNAKRQQDVTVAKLSRPTAVDCSKSVAYGYESLAPECAGESPFSLKAIAQAIQKGTSSVLTPPSDLCAACKLTVEEDCVRLGTHQRWHPHCIKCVICGKVAAVAPAKGEDKAAAAEVAANGGSSDNKKPSNVSLARRPPANADDFRYEQLAVEPSSSSDEIPQPKVAIYCTAHATSDCRSGFSAVSRLEQYAFLLNVALRRLYLLLHKRGVMHLTASSTSSSANYDSPTNSYRDSAEILRMKSSVHLDRKLSLTARMPKRSTIVDSPTGSSRGPVPPQAKGGQPPPRSPPPKIPPLNQYDPYPQSAPQGRYGGLVSPLAVSPGQEAHSVRPPFARNDAQVLVVDDEDEFPAALIFSNEDGITLADIPQLLEAQQARERRRSLPRKPLLAEMTPLELVIIKNFAVLALQRSPLKDQFEVDDILELIESKKSTFWNRLFKAGDKKNVKRKGVFGVPLDQLLAEQGTDSMLGSSHAPLRVPIFIDDVISAMRQMDMSIEGIFQKNGNIRRLKELTDALDRDPDSVDLTQENPVQLAALMKKFFRDLPDPLMTFKLHKLWNAVASLPHEGDRKRMLHMLCVILPQSHRDTMEALFLFLKWVASFSYVDEETGSKMDLPELATAICPCILYAEGRGASREDSFTAIPVVTKLLQDQDEFYTVPDDFISILQDQEYFAHCLEMPCKDVLKKADTYLRLKSSGRSPMPGQNRASMQAALLPLPTPNQFDAFEPIP